MCPRLPGGGDCLSVFSYSVGVPDGCALAEPDTLMRMSQVVEQETGRRTVALTGPSHAEEVAKNIPTGCLAAHPDKQLAELIQDINKERVVFRMKSMEKIVKLHREESTCI